jgi:hypothetical protein
MYPIAQDMASLPPHRLKSRKPLWKEEFLMQPFSSSDYYWKAAWQDVDIFNKNLIEDPTKQVLGTEEKSSFILYLCTRPNYNCYF